MSERRRLSVCYAAPGLNLLPTAGPTRNVLSVADALSEWADVTVAFRTILEPIETSKFRVLAMDPASRRVNGYNDDNAARGLHPFRHVAYSRTLWSFARTHARAFDVVLEKGWRVSGLLATACRRAGVAAALVENDVRIWTEPLDGIVSVSKYALHHTAEYLAGAFCRQLPMVIAETEELKSRLVAERGIPADRIAVIGLGVDHLLFRVLDQRLARESLGLAPEPLILLYVGGLDEYHDLEPVIVALGRARRERSIELHVVGDGEYRPRYEELAARAGIASRFHGRVPHVTVPHYIAASDLCIAPYRTSAVPGGEITFSTLKIPEYMACGRPVVSVPSRPIRRLIQEGVNGVLFPNDVDGWMAFLNALPCRERLASMGASAAQAAKSIAWENTAVRYLRVCEQLAS